MSPDTASGISCEVAVVGLGPVGAVLCALLGGRGVDVVAIEPEKELPDYPRAIAADDEMLRTLLKLPGIAGESTLFDTDQRVRVLDAAGRLITTVGFDGSTHGVSGLSFFHQPTLERAVRRVFDSSPSVRTLYGRRVTGLVDCPEGVSLTLDDGARIGAKWVVGCDGAASTVRRLRGLDYTGRTFSEPWVVVDLDGSPPVARLPNFSYVLDPHRPAVNMPRPGGHRFEFMVLPGEKPQAVCADVERLLAAYLSADERSRFRIVRAAVYTFHSRTASRWRDGRVLLAGDAAHCIPPFGGQGLGAGVGDALTLAWRLDEVVRGIASPRVLDDYERERRPRVATMNRTALIVGRLLTAHNRVANTAVNAGLRLANATPWLGARFRAGALRLTPRLRTPRAEHRMHGGQPLPNPLVSGPSGAMVRLDELLPDRWALLGLGTDPLPLVGPALAKALRERGAASFVAAPAGPLAELWAGAPPDSVALIRPDSFIAGVGTSEMLTAVFTRLTGYSARPER